MENQNLQTNQVSIANEKQLYIPSSTEKKKAVMMYLLIWIIAVFVNEKYMSEFQLFHLRQSMGRWMFFIVIIILSLIILFLPVLKYIPVLIILFMIIMLCVFIKQAWSGKYLQEDTERKTYIFAWVGGWILNLFDINIETKIDITKKPE